MTRWPSSRQLLRTPKIIQSNVNLDVCDYEINSCKTIIQTRPDLLEKLGLTIIECDPKSYEIQNRLIKENGYNINIENGDILSRCLDPKIRG